jgi:hypothetical protein
MKEGVDCQISLFCAEFFRFCTQFRAQKTWSRVTLSHSLCSHRMISQSHKFEILDFFDTIKNCFSLFFSAFLKRKI